VGSEMCIRDSPHPLLDFNGPEHEGQLRSILDPILTHTGAAA